MHKHILAALLTLQWPGDKLCQQQQQQLDVVKQRNDTWVAREKYLYLLEDVMTGPVRVSHMQLHHRSLWNICYCHLETMHMPDDGCLFLLLQ